MASLDCQNVWRVVNANITACSWNGLLLSSLSLITWDRALFSFRFENYIPAGMAKRKEILALAVRENVWEPLDCKTVSIFAYSSTCEQSNKRSGTKLKTESETGISLLILRKKPTVLQSREPLKLGLISGYSLRIRDALSSLNHHPWSGWLEKAC